MTFEYNNIIFSFLNKREKTVSTGTLQETEDSPNALQGNYETNLIIPELVQYHQTKYRVTEIGQFSFTKATELESVYIPASIIAIRKKAFYGLSTLKTLTFAENSRLQILESNSFYDLYAIPNIVFTSNCLKTIESASMAFAKSIHQLVLPSSLTQLSQSSLAGMEN